MIRETAGKQREGRARAGETGGVVAAMPLQWHDE
jgi:hypothetical protein